MSKKMLFNLIEPGYYSSITFLVVKIRGFRESTDNRQYFNAQSLRCIFGRKRTGQLVV